MIGTLDAGTDMSKRQIPCHHPMCVLPGCTTRNKTDLVFDGDVSAVSASSTGSHSTSAQKHRSESVDGYNWLLGSTGRRISCRSVSLVTLDILVLLSKKH